jgi:hypothetical protein
LTRKRTRLIHSLALAIWALGCAHASYQGGVYRDDEASYHIGAFGAGWQRLELEAETALAFEAPSLDAVAQVNASCDPALDLPLSSLTNHLLIGFTEREGRSEETLPFAGREALFTDVTAKLDGVPRRLRLAVLKKDGCVYDFALVGPADARFERARRDFDAWLAGFSTP